MNLAFIKSKNLLFGISIAFVSVVVFVSVYSFSGAGKLPVLNSSPFSIMSNRTSFSYTEKSLDLLGIRVVGHEKNSYETTIYLSSTGTVQVGTLTPAFAILLTSCGNDKKKIISMRAVPFNDSRTNQISMPNLKGTTDNREICIGCFFQEDLYRSARDGSAIPFYTKHLPECTFE